VHLTAKVLAGKPVRGLMDEAEYEKEQPELRQIQKALVGKVVIELHVGLDRTPAGDEDRCLKEEERHHGHHAPGTVNIFAGHTVEPGEITIGIPTRKAHVAEVEFGCALWCGGYARRSASR